MDKPVYVKHNYLLLLCFVVLYFIVRIFYIPTTTTASNQLQRQRIKKHQKNEEINFPPKKTQHKTINEI